MTARRARTLSSCSVTTLWRTAFAADPGIVGRTIELNRRRFTVAGVAAEDTHGGRFLSIGYFAPLSTGPS